MIVTQTVEDVTKIVGRGQDASFRLVGLSPELGSTITRPSDGATWKLNGIISFVRPRRPDRGDNVGFALTGDAIVARGDVIQWEVPDE